MSKLEKYFNIVNRTYWILFLILIIIFIPFANSFLFSKKTFNEIEKEFLADKDRIEETDFTDEDDAEKTDDSDKTDETDESKKSDTLSKDVTAVVWDWLDYKSKHNKIKVVVKNADVTSAVVSRTNFFFNNDWGAFYRSLHVKSLPAMMPLINAMKKNIKAKNLNYQQAMDYVVSSIQYIPYTLISDKNECPCYLFEINFKNDCSPRKDGRGCCNNVYPGAVYSPSEFLTQKTGDCDTKSLFAYSILKKLGFDVAVIVGEVDGGYHAMLGVNMLNPPVVTKYVKYNGKNYYPWEVTGGNSRLGDMRMWDTWRNWSVALN